MCVSIAFWLNLSDDLFGIGDGILNGYLVRTELMYVAKYKDDLWLMVKGPPNSKIIGFLAKSIEVERIMFMA